jgi:CDP-diacylglycerol--glycerol-3-phosphate 3-phosphatidyltransferase
MTLANAISISRIFLTIPLVLIFEDIANGMNEKLWQAFALIIIIVLTDFLDGYVARKAEEITNFGKLIDPVADKVCMMVVLIYLIISYKLPFLLFFLILGIRDIFLIIIGVYLMFSQEEVFQSNKSGKWFIGISALMMVLFLLKDPLNIPNLILWSFYLISTLLFTFSTFEYIRRYLRYFKELEAR